MNPLQIIVCAKQVPDPEGPADAFEVNPEEKKVIPVGIPPVINPYDENALELALRIKERYGAVITVISMGQSLAQPILRKVLAAGADNLILLVDPLFQDLTNQSIAYVLYKAIKKIVFYDLILTGRQASDWDFGVTGIFIGEMLQIPVIHLAQKIEIERDHVLVEKLCDNGYQVLKAPIPVLVTVSSESGELRYVSVQALRAVSKKPVVIYTAKDLELDERELMTWQIFNLNKFNEKRECFFVKGETLGEKGENLALKLKQDGVI